MLKHFQHQEKGSILFYGLMLRKCYVRHMVTIKQGRLAHCAKYLICFRLAIRQNQLNLRSSPLKITPLLKDCIILAQLCEVHCTITFTETFFSEPTGSVGPQLSSRTIDIKTVSSNASAVALCPAQAFPVPFFR